MCDHHHYLTLEHFPHLPAPPKNLYLLTATLQALVNTILPSVSIDLCVLLRINRITQYETLSFFLHSMVVSRFILIPSSHSSADGHWCYFHTLATMNNKHLCTSFCVYIYFQFSWIYTYEWILGHMVTLCLMFVETTSFPKQLHHFTFLPAKSEGSNTVHNFYHSCHSGCEMTPHCGFDLHFPSEKGGEGNGNPLQYSCNPMDRGAWWAAVHGVTKGRT